MRRRDARAPVVYLRPFDEDRGATNETISAGDVVYVYSMPTYRSLELLNDVGPVATVARPGFAARLGLYPTSGPYIEYVDDARWQADVQALLAAPA